MIIQDADGYAGDVTPLQAWRLLQDEADAVLVDVRTRPEWAFVGIVDLSALAKEPVLLEWQSFPAMDVAADFTARMAEALARKGAGPDTALLFICRSGQRSQAAAQAMTAAGHRRCFNVAGGFEGRLDGTGHRGNLEGWKADGLAWRQS